MQRVADYLAGGRWYRRVGSQEQVAVGGHMYHLGEAYARQEVEITFDPQTWELVFQLNRESSSRASADSGGDESGPDGRSGASGPSHPHRKPRRHRRQPYAHHRPQSLRRRLRPLRCARSDIFVRRQLPL